MKDILLIKGVIMNTEQLLRLAAKAAGLHVESYTESASSMSQGLCYVASKLGAEVDVPAELL